MATSVFVSGATGYIAQHIVKQLIEKGYKVVGSVRSTEKGDQLKANLNSPNFEYVIVKDIAEKGAFDQALKDHPEVTVFLHTASPFFFNPKDPENDFLIPAVEGTKNALNAIKDYAPQVKKVVITSSYAAVAPREGTLTADDVVDETSWNPVTYEEAKTNPPDAYRGSKTFAEKAAWDFVKEQKPNFTLNTVNPSFVFGPQAFDSEVKDTLNTSSELFNSIVKLGPNDPLPVFRGGYVDVRDVGRTHLHAFESDVTNFRYLLANGKFSSQHIADIINENIPELKGKIPVGTPGEGDKNIASLNKIDNSKTAEKVGPFISSKDTVVDSINQIIKKKSA